MKDNASKDNGTAKDNGTSKDIAALPAATTAPVVVHHSPTSQHSPLIGSGSPEEVVRRVNVLLDMGTSRGYLTYEELNTKLPDEVVSPDRLDSLLMTIDEMGIKLIDEYDVDEFKRNKGEVDGLPSLKPVAKVAAKAASVVAAKVPKVKAPPVSANLGQPAATGPDGQPLSKNPDEDGFDPNAVEEADDEEDLSDLEKELAEAGNKRIDDPVRMYLTQMGEIPLLTREQEIYLAKKIEITRKIYRTRVLESDYTINEAVKILRQVETGDLPFDRTMKISTAEDQADKVTIGIRIPFSLGTISQLIDRNRADWDAFRAVEGQEGTERDDDPSACAGVAGAAASCSRSCRCARAGSSPLSKRLQSISNKMTELVERIEQLKKLKNPGEDLEVCEQELSGLEDLVLEDAENLRKRVSQTRKIFNKYEDAKRKLSAATCASSCRSPRSTATAVCRSSTSSRRATPA